MIGWIPGGRIEAFGLSDNRIGSILVINLNRQPKRWRRVLRELGRFRTFDGTSLVGISRRFPAVDARDGRAVAATADIDSTYRIGDQLYVQPDARLEECFGADQLIRMTRQEVAVARSHIEVWKTVANGREKYVLVLEDDVWFRYDAPRAIERGWQAAIKRYPSQGGPHLLYLSYWDAGGTAERADVCEALFRPIRGLWFLSGYVLSREGAGALLRAMPVIGPVDLWMNYRFRELDILALSSSVIPQRPDGVSDNSFSILPYLARAGIVDAGSAPMSPVRVHAVRVVAWTAGGPRESLPMALSMLGLRVRVFDGSEAALDAPDLLRILDSFDAIVDAPLTASALVAAIERADTKFILEAGVRLITDLTVERLPSSRTVVLPDIGSWKEICVLLGLGEPSQAFPLGAPRISNLFRDDRSKKAHIDAAPTRKSYPLDDSPWVLPLTCGWQARLPWNQPEVFGGRCLARAAMTTATRLFPGLIETFPGNLASFAPEGLKHDENGASLIISRFTTGHRPYRSGAFASEGSFEYGRFEATIKSARGAGLITGFFLHRAAPRQEIDIEIAGDDPTCMLVNVFFNPGDDGADISFGYRGTPCRIDLGFNAAAGFHNYVIDWRPRRIAWLVDGSVLHERVSWDPTPIPHHPMRLHANLWAPSSAALAGKIDEGTLPAIATFKDISVQAW